MVAEVALVKLPSDDGGKSTLVQAFGQQAITWASVGPELCRHMASLGHNNLTNCIMIWLLMVIIDNGKYAIWCITFPQTLQSLTSAMYRFFSPGFKWGNI